MTETQKVLDRLSRALAGASDYKIAKLLKVSRSAVSNWRCGRGTFSEETARQIAALLGENPLYVEAAAITDRAETPEQKSAWLAAAKKISRAAAVLMPLASIIALAAHNSDGQHALALMYIM